MIKITIDGRIYRLPVGLSEFQKDLYVHLVDWKRAHITTDPGAYRYKGRAIEYDAILPDRYRQHKQLPHVYEPVVPHLERHRAKNPFRIHEHFYHMASSQVANINLFLPILHSPQVNRILRALKPDFKELATDQLDDGYCVEYWGDNYQPSRSKGPLGDKTAMAGTDSDLAIAYRNHDGALCLWLIEHKLTEKEFTACGGFKSRGRKDKQRHDCTRTFQGILDDKSACYYHDVCRYRYWDITDANRSFFVNHGQHTGCPFQGGMNQLWRNQLLALAIENDKAYPFEQACFSAVRHPRNKALDPTLDAYRELTGNSDRFFAFTSADVLASATAHADAPLHDWICWYRELYDI